MGLGQFVTLLTYKANWYGKNILKANRFFASSKICSHCHYKLDSLPLSEACLILHQISIVIMVGHGNWYL
nr:transposase [Moraxella catarrhalis]